MAILLSNFASAGLSDFIDEKVDKIGLPSPITNVMQKIGDFFDMLQIFFLNLSMIFIFVLFILEIMLMVWLPVKIEPFISKLRSILEKVMTINLK
jgi:hypothetical protein